MLNTSQFILMVTNNIIYFGYNMKEFTKINKRYEVVFLLRFKSMSKHFYILTIR